MLRMVSYPRRPQSGHITCYLNRTYHVLPTLRCSGGWQVGEVRVGYPFLNDLKGISPMTNRVTYAPQDFQKMCKQAERDHESKKLVTLIERVKRQIAERESRGLKPQVPSLSAANSVVRLPSRSVPFER
jgi:hypothetical protein